MTSWRFGFVKCAGLLGISNWPFESRVFKSYIFFGRMGVPILTFVRSTEHRSMQRMSQLRGKRMSVLASQCTSPAICVFHVVPSRGAALRSTASVERSGYHLRGAPKWGSHIPRVLLAFDSRLRGGCIHPSGPQCRANAGLKPPVGQSEYETSASQNPKYLEEESAMDS